MIAHQNAGTKISPENRLPNQNLNNNINQIKPNNQQQTCLNPCPSSCSPTCDVSCCAPYMMAEKQHISMNSQGCLGDCLNHCYDFCNPNCCSYFPTVRSHILRKIPANKQIK
ncbi:hypothetical protein HZS_5297 [Henneguya salminicola]|nr:hypothetical protein HZS_5297 [Henneguya salminicola]